MRLEVMLPAAGEDAPNSGEVMVRGAEVVLLATRGDASSGGTRGDAPGNERGAPRQERMLTAAEVFFSTMLRYKIFLLHLLCGFAII